VLSTGRCGTLWLTEFLRHSKRTHVNHSDYPELIREGRLAYEQYARIPEMFHEILRATRDGYILGAYVHGRKYIETNNRITFFARAIRQVYPRSKYIHLYRHPADFVRSGLRRGWYRGHSHDIGRIVRLDDQALWEQMSDIAKIAWLWNETNQWIEDFILEQPMSNVLQIRAEDMFTNISLALAICDFVGVTDITEVVTRRLQRRRINVQKTGKVEPYEKWSDAEKRQIRHQVPLAYKYGYTL
jgi:hypothetical protein